MSVCKCDECSFFNYCINMDFESVNKDLFIYKIPPGHNRTNGAVYSKINFKVEISSAIQLGPKYERQLNSMAEPTPPCHTPPRTYS